MRGAFLTCYPYISQTGNKMAMDQDKVPIHHPGPNNSPTVQTPPAVERERHWYEFMPVLQDRGQMSRYKRSDSKDNSSSQAAALVVPQVASTPTTSTATPGCRQRKSVEKASKSTFLSEVDFSRVTEMCMGMNELPFTRLWDIMGTISKLRSKGKPTSIQTNKEDHAKEEISRLTLGQYLTVSDGTKTICVGPNPRLGRNSLYKLIESAEGEDDFLMGLSLYLVTGWNTDHDAVTWERLIVNNSMEEMATVYLGTTDMWRISGNLGLKSRVKGQHEISLDMDGLGVTLTRQVTKWSVLYTVEIRVQVLEGKSYDGLLWGIYSGEEGLISSEETTPFGDDQCYPLTPDQNAMSQYTFSPLEFTHYFLDLLYDLTKNLPSYMFE